VIEPTEARSGFEGRVVRLDVETWPELGPYEVVHHLGAAAVLPITTEGRVLLVRQFRPPVRQILTEIPAGLLDIDGEDALTCARRELMEETGYRAISIEFLGGYYSSAGFTDEYVHLFWARTPARPDAEHEPRIEVVTEALGAMTDAAFGGRIRDVKTAMALMMAARRPALPLD
jgi:ADP-ribose pyrophosphatase